MQDLMKGVDFFTGGRYGAVSFSALVKVVDFNQRDPLIRKD